eukprot:TRINITY_DN6965_c0_g1_i1.p1 TRINITY_DN6965_c0_g1~~TRINITY_DN6965_c0_g1_i1.p1  ORF type:complete len:1501 (+),score=370.60 TRINITY_DN6965_c0_g1_i1:71-4573(+)
MPGMQPGAGGGAGDYHYAQVPEDEAATSAMAATPPPGRRGTAVGTSSSPGSPETLVGEVPAHGEALRKVHTRRTTDVCALCTFIFYWFGMFWISYTSLKNGNPRRLLHSFDYKGQLCGVDSGVENKNLLYWPRPEDPRYPICVESCPLNAQKMVTFPEEAASVSYGPHGTETATITSRDTEVPTYPSIVMGDRFCLPLDLPHATDSSVKMTSSPPPMHAGAVTVPNITDANRSIETTPAPTMLTQPNMENSSHNAAKLGNDTRLAKGVKDSKHKKADEVDDFLNKTKAVKDVAKVGTDERENTTIGSLTHLKTNTDSDFQNEPQAVNDTRHDVAKLEKDTHEAKDAKDSKHKKANEIDDFLNQTEAINSVAKVDNDGRESNTLSKLTHPKTNAFSSFPNITQAVNDTRHDATRLEKDTREATGANNSKHKKAYEVDGSLNETEAIKDAAKLETDAHKGKHKQLAKHHKTSVVNDFPTKTKAARDTYNLDHVSSHDVAEHPKKDPRDGGITKHEQHKADKSNSSLGSSTTEMEDDKDPEQISTLRTNEQQDPSQTRSSVHGEEQLLHDVVTQHTHYSAGADRKHFSNGGRIENSSVLSSATDAGGANVSAFDDSVEPAFHGVGPAEEGFGKDVESMPFGHQAAVHGVSTDETGLEEESMSTGREDASSNRSSHSDSRRLFANTSAQSQSSILPVMESSPELAALLDSQARSPGAFFRKILADMGSAWLVLLLSVLLAGLLGYLYLLLMKSCAWTFSFGVLGLLFLASVSMSVYCLVFVGDDEEKADDLFGRYTENPTYISRVVGWTCVGIGVLLIGLFIVFYRTMRRAVGCIDVSSQVIWAYGPLPRMPAVELCVKTVFTLAWAFLFLFVVSSGSVAAASLDINGTPVSARLKTFSSSPLQKLYVVYFIIGYFWNLEFIHMVFQFSVSFCTVSWYFTPCRSDQTKTELDNNVWKQGIIYALRYHMGSLALGAAITSLFRPIHAPMAIVSKQARFLERHASASAMANCLCCVWCFEEIVRYINKNAIIYMVLNSDNFFVSAGAAVKLVTRADQDIGKVNGITGSFHSIGLLGTVSLACYLSTVALGGCALYASQDSKLYIENRVAIVAAAGLFSAGVASCFMSLFDVVFDTLLFCWLSDNKQEEVIFAPGQLVDVLGDPKARPVFDDDDADLEANLRMPSPGPVRGGSERASSSAAAAAEQGNMRRQVPDSRPGEEEEALARRREAAARKAKEEREVRKAAEEETTRKEAAAQRAAQEEAARKAELEAAARKARDEAARKAEQEAAARKAKEEAALKAEQEAAARKAQEEAARKAEQEAEAKKAQEEAARQAKALEEAARRAEQEAEARKAQEEAARKAEQDAAAQKAREEAARQEEREAAARKIQEEADHKARQQAAAKKLEEEEAARKAELEAAARKAKEEAAGKAEEQAARQHAQQEAAPWAEPVAPQMSLEEAITKARAMPATEGAGGESSAFQAPVSETAAVRPPADDWATFPDIGE